MGLLDFLKPKQKPLELTGYVYDMGKHKGWGDSIEWMDYSTRRIVGHLQRRPQVGDEIITRMQSGKVARYYVKTVDHKWDPADMFFADVIDIGYEGEEPINPVKEAASREIEPNNGRPRLLI